MFTVLTVLTLLTVFIMLTVLIVYRAATSIDNSIFYPKPIFFSKNGVNLIFFDTFLGIVIGNFLKLHCLV